MSERTCKTCGAALVRRPTEQSKHFEKRQSCGSVCSWALIRGDRSVRREKTCLSCGKVMKPGDYPSNWTQWRKRKACSETCVRALIGRQNSISLKIDWKDEARKTCPICESTFTPREGEPRCKFRQRQFCSQACKGINHRKLTDVVKRCSWCGEDFRRREGENTQPFRKRMTCSPECGFKQRRHNRITGQRSRLNPYPAEWTPQFRQMIRERDGNCCQLCGATRGKRELPIHHIDYNKQNTRPDNLVTLCHTCHLPTNYDRDYWHAYFVTFMAEREDVDLAA